MISFVNTVVKDDLMKTYTNHQPDQQDMILSLKLLFQGKSNQLTRKNPSE